MTTLSTIDPAIAYLAVDAIARDDWYVVAFSREIPVGATERSVLLGQTIQTTHLGTREWACAVLHPDGSASPVPSVVERYGFVWVTLGAPSRPVVDIAEFAETDRRFVWRGRIGVPISGQRVIENFFDLAHFSFVHTGTLGGMEAAQVPRYAVETRDDGRELWATGCSFFQPKASTSATGGRSIFYDYRVPSPFISIIYKDSLVRPGRKDLIGLFVQPHGEEDCTVHSFVLVFDDVKSDTDILHFFHEIFAQDRMILVQQTPKKLPVHDRRERHVASDASAIAYRRWVDRSGLCFGVDRDPPAEAS